MRGGVTAAMIAAEMRREKYFKDKKRAKCMVDKKKQCVKCKYQKICEDAEDERNNSIESDK